MTCPISSSRLTTLSLALAGAVVLAGCGDDMEAREAMDYDESMDEAAAEVADASDMEASGTATLDVSEDFAEVDLNGDSELSMDEVTEWAKRTGFSYASWSGSDDTTSTGLYGGLFTRFDSDEDGTVTRMEWEAHAPLFPSDILAGSEFSTWDADGSGQLDRTEVVAGFETTELHARVDLDDSATIDDAELIEWFYDFVDTNDDEVIDPAEWSAANRFHVSIER